MNESNVSLDSIKIFISSGGNLNYDWKDGTYFHGLVKHIKDFNTLKYCIEVGGDINRKNKNGDTVFHILIRFNDFFKLSLDVLKYCVEVAHADVTTVKATLLRKVNDFETLKYCVEMLNCDINETNEYGRTPMSELCRFRSELMTLDVLKYCVEVAKADMNIPDITLNKTPFFFLCEKNKYTSIDLFMPMLRYCIENANCDLNVITDRHQSPFFKICEMCEYDNMEECSSMLVYLRDCGKLKPETIKLMMEYQGREFRCSYGKIFGYEW